VVKMEPMTGIEPAFSAWEAISKHLINTDDHASNMAALGALATRPTPSYTGNVVPLHG
jgi:hypothetical protein